METIKEIYLNSPEVDADNWKQLIELISKFNGPLKKWSLIISIDDKKIRYFLSTKRNLPPTLNNLSMFYLKDEEITIPSSKKEIWPVILKSNLINTIELYNIRHSSNLKFICIKFNFLWSNNIKYHTQIYYKKGSNIYRRKAILKDIEQFLSINFKQNNSYLYKKISDYLDISKCLHLLQSDEANAILKIDTYPYLQGDFYLNELNYSFAKHSLIIGASGVGKSKFISSFIFNIYKNIELNTKYKVVVIDPHASLENDIGGLAKVIDFSDTLYSNNLFVNSSSDVVVSVELLLDLFKSLLNEQYNSQVERVLRYAIYLLLVKEDFNFNSLRKVIFETEYRNTLIKELESKLPKSVIDFFLADYNNIKTQQYTIAIAPIVSFLDEMETIPIFDKIGNTPTIEETIKDNFLTIYSLNRIKLGDKVLKTISGLIMQQLLTLIQKYTFNEHLIFIIDEMAIVENPILLRFLAESRKYNLSIILAGQYFSQISNALKDAIYANTVNYYLFRTSKKDAEEIIDNLNVKLATNDTRENKIKLLTELQNRDMIVRVEDKMLLPAMKGRTMDYESIPHIKTLTKKVSDTNNQTKETKKFTINNSIKLKDVLLMNSTSRKVNKND